MASPARALIYGANTVLRLHSLGFWKKIKSLASGAARREAAVAYVTQDLIGFKKGDSLVVNAHQGAIASGETSAKLLQKLHRRGVRLYSNRDLHAKVLLLGDTAVVGSGNMSNSSQHNLVEAGIFSDNPSVAAGVASFIDQLIRQSLPLDAARIAQLCKIKVVRRGWQGGVVNKRKRKTKIQPIVGRTWLVGVYEELEMTERERAYAKEAGQKIARRLKIPVRDVTFIQCGSSSRFDLQSRGGDTIIQIWRKTAKSKPTRALKALPILGKGKLDGKIYVFIRETTQRQAAIGLGKFKALLKATGYTRKIGPNTERELSSEAADAINLQWKQAAK